MVAFTSILLGLVVGQAPVELSVGEEVAAVELRLDGRAVATLRAAPWVEVVDFGDRLEPHELLAVAFDRRGRELERAQQWVNVPQRSAEAAIVLSGGERGRGVTARLVWESVVAAEPTRVRVRFDGRPLAVDDPRRILLPDHDPQQLHVLRAELDFSDNVSSIAEITFGGSYADHVASELTAVPVELIRGSRLPSLTALGGRFTAGGAPAEVVAEEAGPAEVVVVKDETAHQDLLALGRRSRRALEERAQLGRATQGAEAGQAGLLRISLKQDLRMRFVWPTPQLEMRGDHSLQVFPPSEVFTWRDGDLYWLLTYVRPPGEALGRQRIPDAVAAGALIAARSNRRRALVLILGAEPPPDGQLTPAQVRHFLRALRVPLVVWSTRPGNGSWPGAIDVSSPRKLRRATRELYAALDRQRIVWLEGRHLPQSVALAAEGLGVALVR